MILKAIKNKDVSSILSAIEAGEDVNEKTKRNGHTPLTLACEIGHLEIVKLMLHAGADPNLPGELGYSPLMCAACSFKTSSEALEVCKELVAKGAVIDALNDDGENVMEVLLFAPGKKGNGLIAEFLITEMIKRDNTMDLAKLSHLVVDFGHLSTLKFLFHNGLDVETEDRFGYTLLHAATRKRAVKKVDFLLKAGANFNYKPKLGWENHPFELACRLGRIDWLEFLKKHGFKLESNPDLLQAGINSAVECGNWKALNFLELEGIDLCKKRGNSKSALSTAIQFDQGETFSRLLERNPNLNEVDEDGNSLLLHAAYFGRFEILKRLLDTGANINAVNALSWNALMQACAEGNFAIAQFLISFQIELEQRCSETGATPLIIAATEGHDNIVEALLIAGANPHVHAHDGKTAATAAMANQRSSVFKLFGVIKPHFIAYHNTDDTIVCAYCSQILSETMANDTYCKGCNAHYCNSHFPWSSWKLMSQTSVYPERMATCPNGHSTWQQWPE
jgi:ankyrin repeat protein